MMKSLRFTLLITAGLVLFLTGHARTQPFVMTLGGSITEEGRSVTRSSDGGFVVAGNTSSFGPSDENLLLAKFDSSGNHLWTRTLGGSSNDAGNSVIEASDEGLVVTGITFSYGTVLADMLLAKFDASGNHLWTRTLGGANIERGFCIIEAADTGLVVAGQTGSFGAGHYDLLLAKFDASGNHLWTTTLGGTESDRAHCIIEASDGGFVVVGFTATFGAGNHDLLLAKFDASGNHLWTRVLGGSQDDEGRSVIQASDGGLVAAGFTWTFGAGNSDVLLAKFDASGNHLWTRTLGGSSSEGGYCVIQASDGGLVVTGGTDSFGAGDRDMLLAKFDASGNYLWAWVLGGSSYENGGSVVQSMDGGFAVTGPTRSFGAGVQDLFLAKFDGSGNTCLGGFVTPTITSVDPTITIADPVISSPDAIIASPDPTITSPDPTLTTVCDVLPKILSITDVGNDQGKQVRVEWERCHYDDSGSPLTITEYGLWRRIDEDKFNGQSHEIGLCDSEMLGGVRPYPPGDWDFVKTVPARAESVYNTVCPSLGDSTMAEGMYWSVFFVSAMTSDPSIYFDSDPDSGYSLDNIPPLPIRDMEINPSSWFTLEWTVPGEYVGEEPISGYDIRYSTVPVGPDTQAWWEDAVGCTGNNFFKFTVGERDSLHLATEASCHPHVYLAIKGLDERPNASEISNILHFTCGDANGDEVVDLGDAVKVLNYLFKGQPPPQPLASGDAACDELVDLGDVVHLLNYLFKSGPEPCSE